MKRAREYPHSTAYLISIATHVNEDILSINVACSVSPLSVQYGL